MQALYFHIMVSENNSIGEIWTIHLVLSFDVWKGVTHEKLLLMFDSFGSATAVET